MNVSQLLEALAQKGIDLWVDEEKLKIRSPKGVLTPALSTELAQHKQEILSFLRGNTSTISNLPQTNNQALSLQTIGRLIGGFGDDSSVDFTTPTIEPRAMAKKLKVTFKPLPDGYKEDAIKKFREDLKFKLQDCGVQIIPWEQATKEFCYDINIPLIEWKKSVKVPLVKSGISAVIDVERNPNKIKTFIAEKLYQFYCRFVLKNRKLAFSKIGQFISWAEDNIHPLEDPTNTQVIVLTRINQEFVNPTLPYQQKIPIGVNALIKTFSQIVIGVSTTHISILNMNLSDSVFPIEAIDEFVLQSLIPKIHVPILPLPMSRFEVGEYDPTQSCYAAKLVRLGQELDSTGLLPASFKLDDVITRKSHRDMVDWLANGRTGVSYGFVAYAEPPKYIGEPEISEKKWEELLSVDEFSSNEVRQNSLGRSYVKIRIGNQYQFKQIPDIWLVSSRSGSNKTNLQLEQDVLRIGLKGKLLLQLPQGLDPAIADIKPSYDIYVMVAIALASALYAPELVKDGTPMVHFHGYPSIDWFKTNEYCTGIKNPSVPCGTYEAGVFNFLGICNVATQNDQNIRLISLIEPDHGTNIIARDWESLVEKLKSGVKQGQIELGGKHFQSLKENPVNVDCFAKN
ncbi:MAG: hypothetical protein AAGF83_04890 [Cyanobacteria bacterium P01_G01_bin.67]